MIGKPINRSDLIRKMALKYNINPNIAETVVKTIIDTMASHLIKSKRIEIRGFGSFELRLRKPRKARNPKTGETVYTDSKYVIHFKPGKEMRQRVNESRDT